MRTLDNYRGKALLDLSPEYIPPRPHHVVLVYTATSTRDDDLPCQAITYFAFDSESDWQRMIQEFTMEQINNPSYNHKYKIAFFHSSGCGRIELKVLVGMAPPT